MLVAFEGIDGSGKSTQARKLYEHLTKKGLKVELLREPGSTEGAERVRELLKNYAFLPEAELLLFEAARAELVRRRVLPALREGKLVILDRFTLSTLAYQGYGRGLPLELIDELNRFASAGLRADAFVLLDLPVEEALRRIKRADRFEERSFLERVREGFLKLAERDERVLLVDAAGSEEEVFRRVLKALSGVLGV
ncbi:MAG: dTMP kinase [Aquificae bacterium]|nr:dTMP kinase [Aquificota bacterium]